MQDPCTGVVAPISSCPAGNGARSTLWQDLRLVEELSVIQNINSGALGRHGLLWAIRNLLGPLDPNTCLELMHQAKLEADLLKQPVRELSGGQRQRVALGRLLLSGLNSCWRTNPSPPLIPASPKTFSTPCFCCRAV